MRPRRDGISSRAVAPLCFANDFSTIFKKPTALHLNRILSNLANKQLYTHTHTEKVWRSGGIEAVMMIFCVVFFGRANGSGMGMIGPVSWLGGPGRRWDEMDFVHLVCNR